MFQRLWSDDSGYILSAESFFIATILVLGIVTGWVTVRNAVNEELNEVANAFTVLDQSYSFCGLTVCCAESAGSHGDDQANTDAIGPVGVDPTNIFVDVCP